MELSRPRVIDNLLKESQGPQDVVDNKVVDQSKDDAGNGTCNDLLPCVIVQMDAAGDQET